MFATDGPTWFAVTQSTPAITPELDPEPLQSRTRTACSVTCFATPYVVPPTVPETWVPCPLQSFVPPPTSSTPLLMRGADAGVDDVGVNAGTVLVVVVGVVQRQVALVDPVEAPRGRGLRRDR